jgi:acetyl esterase/lipase
MMELERIENIPYGLLTDRAHLLDLLKPRAATTPLPVVIHFHGGGWRMFGKYLTDCEFLAEAGFCTISANYRYMQEELFPAQLEDAQAVVAWVRKHADQYGLDANRIGVWGISAGGHIAALLGVRGLEHHIKAAASVCAPTDLTSGADWALEYAIARCACGAAPGFSSSS